MKTAIVKTAPMALGSLFVLISVATALAQDNTPPPPKDTGSAAGAAPQTTATTPPLHKIGNGVSPPRAIYMPEPEYTKKARKAKYQGTCVLEMTIGADGLPHDIKVVRALGMGLDEKAMAAVQKWKFEPARKDGQPVATRINVEVAFRLY